MWICGCQRCTHRHTWGQVNISYSISLIKVYIHCKSTAAKIAGIGKAVLNTLLGLL
jgi:hypothetical protein